MYTFFLFNVKKHKNNHYFTYLMNKEKNICDIFDL